MGQAQSDENSIPSTTTTTNTPPSTNSPRDSHGDNTSSPSMDSLLAEAAAYGEDENEDEPLEAKAQRALDCPCIADLRNGSCGSQFSEAFLCFLKSTAEEKGSDCVNPFVALQSCIKANPDAFSKSVTDDEEEKTEKKEEQPPVQDHRIIPPLWAKDPPRSNNSKL
ncbi:PREDICTED: mitochondrial intermembrane space import and assembly protein 40-like [Camelina sativa]|uniref:Mitochondrial intermembrane space import and assembly protein 40-like n=1 Tax=Camelina sativa TaxID=90675 RepID=A0ABM0VDP2_CAMSA|nr:PREDICTED: mitochondrial intermembrane space import and assembly protein 40-like [Camelina sativa]